MNISYETQQLRDCCTLQEMAESDLDETHARDLMTLISEAETVDTANELIDLYDDHAETEGVTLSIDVGTGYRATFEPAETEHDAENIDWRSVDCLKLMDLRKC